MSIKAVKRLSSELKEMIKSPPPLADARPDESNILKWYFVLEGAPDTAYEGGEYLGELIFPEQYPFKPPAIKMTTPSGRFKTQTRLCFSMSDFHPEEWSPMWGVRQILIGLNSFMSEAATTHGSITTTEAVKRELAVKSHSFNVTQREYERLFPDRCADAVQRIAAAEEVASLADAKKQRKRREAAEAAAAGDDASTAAAAAAAAAATAPVAAFAKGGLATSVAGFFGTWRGAVFVIGAASVAMAAFSIGGGNPGAGGAGPATSASTASWGAPPVAGSP